MGIHRCSVKEDAGQPRSAEHIFREYLEGSATPSEEKAPAPLAVTEKSGLSEHLWLVARWYYSNPREGEIFFREKDWPYRRILRACSRLLAPKGQATSDGSAGPSKSDKGAS